MCDENIEHRQDGWIGLVSPHRNCAPHLHDEPMFDEPLTSIISVNQVKSGEFYLYVNVSQK